MGGGLPNYPPLDYRPVSNKMLIYRQTFAVVIKYSYFTQYLRVHRIFKKYLKSACNSTIIKSIYDLQNTNKQKHIHQTFIVDCK